MEEGDLKAMLQLPHMTVHQKAAKLRPTREAVERWEL